MEVVKVDKSVDYTSSPCLKNLGGLLDSGSKNRGLISVIDLQIVCVPGTLGEDCEFLTPKAVEQLVHSFITSIQV